MQYSATGVQQLAQFIPAEASGLLAAASHNTCKPYAVQPPMGDAPGSQYPAGAKHAYP